MAEFTISAIEHQRLLPFTNYSLDNRLDAVAREPDQIVIDDQKAAWAVALIKIWRCPSYEHAQCCPWH